MGTRAVAVCAAVLMWTGDATAQVRTWTLSDVLTRARDQAPQIVSARLALDEARGRLVGASLRSQVNPDLDVVTGNRTGSSGRFTDVQVGLSQTWESGARRSARIDGAQAAITQGGASVDETTRMVLHAAATAYLRAAHAMQRLQLLTTTQDLAVRVATVAERRFRAGDVAVLDVNIARASLARVRAEREAAEAMRARAVGDLRQLLRVEDDLVVEDRFPTLPETTLVAASQAATERPELRALAAAVQEAEADVRLGATFMKPTYGPRVQYSREEGDQVILGGLTITLPVFAKGQELRAVGSARAVRLRAELDAARQRVQIEVRTAFDAYTRRAAAVRVLETEALPGLDENDALTTRSYDVGQLGLPDLLLLRREILDTRFQYLDAVLEAALARVDLDASAGVLR
jgi:cobalt-zinc-cadmium efflux system outer membrane protein